MTIIFEQFSHAVVYDIDIQQANGSIYMKYNEYAERKGIHLFIINLLFTIVPLLYLRLFDRGR